MRYLLSLLVFVVAANADVVVDFHANQTSLTNWDQGGQESITWTGEIKGDREVLTEVHRWETNYLARYGQTYLGVWKKSRDRLRGDTQFTWLKALPIDPFVALSFQTQADPFWSPGQLSQSAGFAVDIGPVRTRAGVAARELFTDKTTLTGGWESVTTLDYTFTEELSLSVRVEVFTPLVEVSPRMETDTTIRWQASKVVSAQFGLEVRRESGSDVQVRQTATVGIGLTL